MVSAGYSLCYVAAMSRWTPKVFGHCTRVSCESSMSILGCVLACVSQGVNNVTDDFGAEINRETPKIPQNSHRKLNT